MKYSYETDWEVYKLQILKSGLGFTDEKLRDIFRGFFK